MAQQHPTENRGVVCDGQGILGFCESGPGVARSWEAGLQQVKFA